METGFRANNDFHKQKKDANKRKLFPVYKNSHFASQNESFVKKIIFHYAVKLFSLTGMSKKSRRKGFPIVE